MITDNWRTKNEYKQNGGQDALSIGYAELIAPMIRAIQQQEMIEALQAQVAALTP